MELKIEKLGEQVFELNEKHSLVVPQPSAGWERLFQVNPQTSQPSSPIAIVKNKMLVSWSVAGKWPKKWFISYEAENVAMQPDL